MAAFRPVPGVLKLVQSGTLSGVPIANVFHIAYSGTPITGQQALAVATQHASAYGNQIAPLVAVDCIMGLFEVFDLSAETAASAIFEANHPGAITGALCPNNAAMVISKAVGRRYRGGHPRTYLAGFPSADLLQGNEWTAQKAADAGNAWSNMVNQIVDLSGVPGLLGEAVVHYTKDHLPLPNPLVDLVVGGIGRQLVGSMRRRLT